MWYWLIFFLSKITRASAGSIPDVTESDPYYKNTKYFWSFDGPQHNRNFTVRNIWGILDGAIKLTSQNNSSMSWLDLGPVNSSCISEPFYCEDGFTLSFWMRINESQTNAVLLKAAQHDAARGININLNEGKFRFCTTGLEWDEFFPKTVGRFLDTTWNFKTWTHVALLWNARKKELKISFNCSEVDYISGGISFDRTAHAFGPPQRLIVGADELAKASEVEIDELAIWDSTLTAEEICFVFHARRVHGKYSPWSEFTPCSKTCGSGVHSRFRTCTDPTPAHGGKNCSKLGPTSETTICMDRKCPINGGYSEWSEFTACSQTCGGGYSTRIRTCTQPEPKYGGKNCSGLGSAREIRVCNLNPCPIHGNYSAWGNFSDCTRSCENGTKYRNRSCDSPWPEHGGRNCSEFGPSFEIMGCNEFPCPVHGGYSPWSNFSECSKSCAGGKKTRVRTCTDPPPLHGGKDCDHYGPSSETVRCNTHFCPVHGGFTQWSEFTSCTKSCGNGTKVRDRTCDNPRPQHGGKNCSGLGPATEVDSCNSFPCPIHGGYTGWSNFSDCTLSCGGGLQTRVRSCINPTPQYGGRNCSHLGSRNETIPCNTHHCPIDGGYTEWTEFTPCTKSCAKGAQFRNRSCTNPKPMYGGLNCSRLGPDHEDRTCNDFPCPIHGGWGEWSGYSGCTRTCAGGRRFRIRECDNPTPKYGGKSCEEISGESGWYWGICGTRPCPVNGGYTRWGDYSTCTRTCGNGTKYRTRNCSNPSPAHGGRGCKRLGPSFQEIFCNTHPCPVHGNYTAWSEFTSCSKTCGNGTQRRYRNCSNPRPMHNGRNCDHFGPSNETRSCFLQVCPIDGIYGPWTRFSTCSTTCGEDGYQTRTRECDSPAPRFGGRSCNRLGAGKQIRACNIFPCPIDGGWSTWSEFSGCSKTCENGERVRTRACDNPPPQYGGRECTVVSGESANHSEECNPQRCPDILFEITIKIMSEEWRDSLLNFNSLEYKKFERKILRNVRDFYGDNSPIRRIKVLKLWKGSVMVLVELHFFNILYSGVMDLQDEIFLQNKLGEFQVNGVNMKSIDVPTVPPYNITAHNISSRSILVKWNDIPKSQCNGNLTSFVVLYSRNNSREYIETVLDPNVYHVVLKNLKIFYPYGIRVVAYNRRGEGVASLPILVWTEMEAPNAAPEIQSSYNLSSTSVYVHWSAIPKENHLGILLGYEVKYRLKKTDEWNSTMLKTTDRDVVLRHLKKFSVYEVTVAGFNRIGRGPASHVYITTDEDIPSEYPSGIKVVNTSSTSLRLSWKPIPPENIHGILQGYGIFYRADHVHVWNNLTVQPDIHSLELSGLKKYQKYYIQVAGLTVKGIGKPCKQIPVMTDEDVPSAPPPDVLAVNTSSTSLLIEWDPLPRAQTHGILRGYVVFYKRRAYRNRPWVLRRTTPTNRAVEIFGLRKFTKYNIQVAGFTSKGIGRKSKLFFVPTGEDTPSRAVNFVSARALSSTSIKVRWGQIPHGQVHGMLRGYKILFRTIDNDGDFFVNQTLPTTYQITLEKLLKFTKYSIRVIGYTSIGNGKASDDINCTTFEDLPSRPPLHIKLRSRWSSTEIPVTWQPIIPSYYVHGILRGYRIKYKPVRDTLKPINATFTWDEIGPDKLEYMIRGLQPFTTYVVQVLAFTSVGDGVESEPGYGETCSCQRVFTTNWWQLTPYTTVDSDKVVGIFPDILKNAIEFCCLDCVHGHAASINFVGSNETKSRQRGIIEVKDNLREEIDFHFPIFGTQYKTSYGNGFPYVPLVHSPGAVFLISSQNEFNESDKIMETILTSWTFIIVLILLSYFVGLIMWFVERKDNSRLFNESFFYGPWDGFWWSFITVTTVGYGDKTPRTVLGRSIAIVWTMCGQIMVVMFVAQITSKISAGIIGEEIRVYGKKVAVIQNSSEYRLGVKKNARYDPDVHYSNLKEIYDDLVNHKVFGALIDTYTVASAKNLFNDAKLTVNNIFDYSLNYGVVLGGEGRKLQPCLENYIKKETDEIHHAVVKHVKPLKDVLTRNVRVEKTQSLFDATSKTYQQIMIITAALLATFVLLGIAKECISKYLPHFKIPIDTRAMVARARDRAFESWQEAVLARITPNNTFTRQMKRRIQRTKRRHLKEIKSYIKERQKAEKRIERALKKEQAKKKREAAKKEREAAKTKREETEKTDENWSDGNLSSTDSEGSLKEYNKNVWEGIEPLEGIFSLV